MKKKSMFLSHHNCSSDGQSIVIRKADYIKDLQDYADWEVNRRKPTDEEINEAFVTTGLFAASPLDYFRIGANWARDFVREEKTEPHNILNCAYCNKMIDKNICFFHTDCFGRETYFCSKKCYDDTEHDKPESLPRFIVAITYAIDVDNGYFFFGSNISYQYSMKDTANQFPQSQIVQKIKQAKQFVVLREEFALNNYEAQKQAQKNLLDTITVNKVEIISSSAIKL